MKTAQPSAVEIDAYVDGELDLSRCFAVEAYLARHPEQAAQVMDDLGRRTALQLLQAPLPPQPAAMAALLGGAARRDRRGVLRPLAAVVGVLFGVAALLAWRRPAPVPPPDYVSAAVLSHRAAMLRATMESQLESPLFDANEIRRATQISMPVLPADWHVTDVQLFPYPRGLALLIAVRTDAGQSLSIFAVCERSSAPARPDAVREGLQSVAYWSENGMSYALTGEDEPGAIDATAETLASLWKS